MKGYNFLGPGTRLDIRLNNDYSPKGTIGIPINNLDKIARSHDITYDKIKRDYLEHGDKSKHIEQIHEADDEFINAANKEGVKGKIAAAVIKLKKAGEESGVVSTKRFSGFGKDPAHRLRLHVNKMKAKRPRRKQHGGLAPWLAALLLAGGIKATEKIIDFIGDKIKNKVEGTGFKQHMKTLSTNQKRKHLINMLK